MPNHQPEFALAQEPLGGFAARREHFKHGTAIATALDRTGAIAFGDLEPKCVSFSVTSESTRSLLDDETYEYC